jgi:hypothetical protein
LIVEYVDFDKLKMNSFDLEAELQGRMNHLPLSHRLHRVVGAHGSWIDEERFHPAHLSKVMFTYAPKNLAEEHCMVVY